MSCRLILFRGDFEFVNPLATVFGDIDIALGIDRDPMSLVELAWEAPGAAKTRQLFAALAIDDVDGGIVLIDDENEPLSRIGGEVDCPHRAPTLLKGAIGRRGHGCPWEIDGLLEISHLVEDAELRSEPV